MFDLARFQVLSDPLLMPGSCVCREPTERSQAHLSALQTQSSLRRKCETRWLLILTKLRYPHLERKFLTCFPVSMYPEESD